MLRQQILGNLFFPLISVAQQLFLIVQQFLVGFGGELEVGSLHDGIDGTGLLALIFNASNRMLFVSSNRQRKNTQYAFIPYQISKQSINQSIKLLLTYPQ